MSEFDWGKCQDCESACEIAGLITADRRRIAESRSTMAGPAYIFELCMFFATRDPALPPLTDPDTYGIFVSAEEFATRMAAKQADICTRHEHRLDDREQQLQSVVAACAGLLLAEFDFQDRPAETIIACSSLNQIKKIRSQFVV